LFLGTNSDNVIDREQKGRGNHAKGESIPWSLLTDDQVREIRRRFRFRDKVNGGRALAKEFGVTFQCISNVVRRKCWKHID
jgi:hypothetical protein